jgi:signal transduction histidine kinase
MNAVALLLAAASSAVIAGAPVDKADSRLAKESESYCASTAETKATPEMIVEKVDEAIALLEKDGAKAYRKLQGKGSPFLFAGTYIWINDLDGHFLMHPLKPGLVGRNLLALKDGNGKRFLAAMIQKVKTDGEGWVDYTWPRPGEKKRSLKVSFVKKAVLEGEEVLVGCGTYDLSEEQVQELAGQ